MDQQSTIELYRSLKREAVERHEYVDGEIIAMAGEKLPHGIISMNRIELFVAQFEHTIAN